MRKPTELATPIPVKFHLTTLADIHTVAAENGITDQATIRKATSIGLAVLKSCVLDFLPPKPAKR